MIVGCASRVELGEGEGCKEDEHPRFRSKEPWHSCRNLNGCCCLVLAAECESCDKEETQGGCLSKEQPLQVPLAEFKN